MDTTMDSRTLEGTIPSSIYSSTVQTKNSKNTGQFYGKNGFGVKMSC